MGFSPRESKASYVQSTTDAEVDANGDVKDLLLRMHLVRELTQAMLHSHHCSPTAFDDMFVVKYEADGDAQRDLIRHYDAGK